MEHDLNILMIFVIKEKWIILTHTMYCWLLLQIYLCYLWLLLCSRVIYEIYISVSWSILGDKVFFYPDPSNEKYRCEYTRLEVMFSNTETEHVYDSSCLISTIIIIVSVIGTWLEKPGKSSLVFCPSKRVFPDALPGKSIKLRKPWASSL